MRDIITIIKKELSRVFGDRKLLITVVLLPGLMIFLMYSLMGKAMSSIVDTEDEEYKIIIINEVDDYEKYLKLTEATYYIERGDENNIEAYRQKVLNEEVDVIIDFGQDFKTKLQNLEKPNVNIYYNPTSELSSEVYGLTISIFSMMENEYLSNANIDPEMFTINKDNPNYEIYDETTMTGQMFSMMMPLLIIIFLFSGAMSIAPESIAGDKERGTMATLLVTPIRRSYIAIGKIASLSLLAVLSAVSSFIGIIASLPKIMGDIDGVDASIYGIGDYILILIVLIVTVLLIVGLISIVSGLARNMKESNSYILPLYFVSMALGITTMFSQSASANPLIYLLPLYNSLQCLVSIFSFEINAINIMICVFSNLVYTGIFVFLLSRMFNNEKIMFSK